MSKLCCLCGVSSACEHKLELHFLSFSLVLKETAATSQLASHFIKAVINFIFKKTSLPSKSFSFGDKCWGIFAYKSLFSRKRLIFFFLTLSKHSLSESFMSQFFVFIRSLMSLFWNRRH